MTGTEICERAKKCKTMKYWYGGKGEIATQALADRLRKQNPSVWTDSYYNRALNDLGKRVGDCSYLVCMAYDRPMIGSYQIVERYEEWDGEPKDGMILWRKGHVGIYEAGRVHELKSQSADYQYNKYNKGEWSAILYDPKVDYDEVLPEAKVGWHHDEIGWYYRHTEGIGKGTYYADRAETIDGKRYVFDREGYICYLMRVRPSDSEGWVYQK